MIDSPQNTNKLPAATGQLAADAGSLEALKRSARSNAPEAIKATAVQFEAMFVNMMLKSMRDASPQNGMLDNEQTRTFTSMLDQQLSQSMAKRGLGLADVLARQLGARAPAVPDLNSAQTSKLEINKLELSKPLSRYQQIGAMLAPVPELLVSNRPEVKAPMTAMPAVDSAANRNAPRHVTQFRQTMLQHAEAASAATGIPAAFMVGQAALESGWGRHQIRQADGSSSHNLFGIKATGNWQGKVAEVPTTEYINGVKQTRVEKFRAYDSYADAFADFARLISGNPRYQSVMANVSDAKAYAQAMQASGYATDPNYASKLAQVIRRSMSA
ncbi:flagellar assembly peptidoglycan hydrolase FlgJ [Pseudomethylobacillus aquaticus]|uniref:Peptidoglycan hydrolase FlgJ n=1 Tax=Pseudomethylobacillus aquaticus TaxID=2676064 RepID=A0A3N0V0B0_9PROT|nr:flagellar assembly peptidoglycan hydrolase FlgJ [Pseudomethylobacillus aquaticus]ROH86135.1 flagellar assembly peptidoglycan hydrolase FlgJ [Pseudomethylobacillus aquaticus]